MTVLRRLIKLLKKFHVSQKLMMNTKIVRCFLELEKAASDLKQLALQSGASMQTKGTYPCQVQPNFTGYEQLTNYYGSEFGYCTNGSFDDKFISNIDR
jgi:hypothetical protein